MKYVRTANNLLAVAIFLFLAFVVVHGHEREDEAIGELDHNAIVANTNGHAFFPIRRFGFFADLSDNPIAMLVCFALLFLVIGIVIVIIVTLKGFA